MIQEQNQQLQQLHPFPRAERPKVRGHGTPYISSGVKRTSKTTFSITNFLYMAVDRSWLLGTARLSQMQAKLNHLLSRKRVQSWLLLPQERDRSTEKSYEGQLAPLGSMRTAIGASRRCPLLRDCPSPLHHTSSREASCSPFRSGFLFPQYL